MYYRNNICAGILAPLCPGEGQTSLVMAGGWRKWSGHKGTKTLNFTKAVVRGKKFMLFMLFMFLMHKRLLLCTTGITFVQESWLLFAMERGRHHL